MCVTVFVRVCVCERERERERASFVIFIKVAANVDSYWRERLTTHMRYNKRLVDTMRSGANVIKLFTAVVYEFS